MNDDIRLNATVRYGVTEGETFQNRATTHQDNLCVYLPARNPAGVVVNDGDFVSLGRNFGPQNGFLDPRAPNPIDPETMQILMDRGRNDANTNNITCAVGPGGFGGTAGQVFQPRPGFQLQKNWRDQIDRRVATDTDQKSISLSANGPLLGADRWTWDAHLQFGGSDREQALYNNQTNFRFAMALDAVYDPTVDRVVCRVNSDASVGGEEIRTQYRNFILGEQAADVALLPPEVVAAAEAQITALRNGCQPINPFGLGYAAGDAEDEARQRAALAYAWDDMIEYTYSDQTIFSGSVSGDFWKGFGAGPLSMAAGIEYRDNETRNAVGGDPNVYVRTDFGTQYGDPWNGLTKASEMFAEFELPLIRDRVGAQSMSINFTGRRTHNETSRRGSDATRFLQENDRNNFKRERDGNSWRASFVWSPVSWLRVRSTRSADIRSPSSRELFFSNTGQSGGFGFSNLLNPWRAEDAEPTGEQYSTIRGSNPNLQNEQSTTETLGLIFSPRGIASGLRLSVDYSQITVKGGISYLNDGFSTSTSDPDNEQNLPYTIYRCYEFDEPFYCSQIQFNPYGSPEMPSDPENPIPCEPRQPCAARADIVAVTDMPENSEPYWTRVVDLSASYSFNMDGGGSIAVRMLATRALEQSRCTNQVRDVDGHAVCENRENVVGVTGGARNNSFFNFSPQAKWSGNVYASYSRGPFAITGQARYTGKGFIAFNPIGPEDPRWAPNLTGTYSINELPSWTTWNLTTSYNFARSRFAPERMQNLQLSMTIDNLFDKQPDFYSGGGVGGVNRRFFNGNGRTFRLNLRTAFN